MSNIRCENCPKVLELEARVKVLESTIVELRGIINEQEILIQQLRKKLEDRDSDDTDHKKPGFAKPSCHKESQKRRGGLPGHTGYGRQVNAHVDEDKHVTLDACPQCGGTLVERKAPEKHTKDDLVIRKVTTRYYVHRYRCMACGCETKGPYKEEFIGSNAKNLGLLLHYYQGMPFEKITEVYGWFGLKITPGALCAWAEKKGDELKEHLEDIKAGLQHSSYAHGDETGWRVDGSNCWLWMFKYPGAVYFQISPSRGSSVVKDVLGDAYGGVLITDFYGAYNKINAKKQKCLVHLLREMKDWPTSGMPEKQFFVDRIKWMLESGKRLAERRDECELQQYEQKVRWFENRFRGFLEIEFKDCDCVRLQKRLRKHRNEVWTFLKENVPYHNNDAERELRRAVVNRKISGGNRSGMGARIQSVLLSVIHTIKARGLNLLETFTNPSKLQFDSS